MCQKYSVSLIGKKNKNLYGCFPFVSSTEIAIKFAGTRIATLFCCKLIAKYVLKHYVLGNLLRTMAIISLDFTV